MRIGLHDSDQTGFPNLALMKISAWHKAQGDTVEWWTPMFPFDRVYSSKVFTFTPECAYIPPDTIKGGTGYGIFFVFGSSRAFERENVTLNSENRVINGILRIKRAFFAGYVDKWGITQLESKWS